VVSEFLLQSTENTTVLLLGMIFAVAGYCGAEGTKPMPRNFLVLNVLVQGVSEVLADLVVQICGPLKARRTAKHFFHLEHALLPAVIAGQHLLVFGALGDLIMDRHYGINADDECVSTNFKPPES
jgi:hypothetical protein